MHNTPIFMTDEQIVYALENNEEFVEQWVSAKYRLHLCEKGYTQKQAYLFSNLRWLAEHGFLRFYNEMLPEEVGYHCPVCEDERDLDEDTLFIKFSNYQVHGPLHMCNRCWNELKEDIVSELDYACEKPYQLCRFMSKNHFWIQKEMIVVPWKYIVKSADVRYINTFYCNDTLSKISFVHLYDALYETGYRTVPDEHLNSTIATMYLTNGEMYTYEFFWYLTSELFDEIKG